jgi:carbon starvation protein CstA
MNKADEEILSILKEVFVPNKKALISPDEHFRHWILRVLLLMSVLGILEIIILKLFTENVASNFLGGSVSFPIALFFGLLFIHINNKSENFSVLIFILSWVSLVVGLFVGSA